MADLADVSTLLATMAGEAVFPNGVSKPSLTGKPVVYGRGWPEPASLDTLILKGGSNISVYAPPNNTDRVFQILNEEYLITPAVHGVSASVSLSGQGATVALSGTPGTGEYVSIVADNRRVYSATGASVSAILSTLAIAASVDYPQVGIAGDSIRFPTAIVTCRIGAIGTKGIVTHRQRQLFFVTVWSPNPTQRDTLAQAIDMYLKQRIRITMPDKSQAILTYEHTNEIDEKSNVTLYRRDLVYKVEYATIETFDAYEITSVSVIPEGSSTGDLPAQTSVS